MTTELKDDFVYVIQESKQNTSNVIIKGHVEIQSEFDEWCHRFIVLKKNTLYVYESEKQHKNNSKPIEQINIKQFNYVEKLDKTYVIESGNKKHSSWYAKDNLKQEKDFLFKLVSRHQKKVFACKYEHDMNKWAQKIKNILKKCCDTLTLLARQDTTQFIKRFLFETNDSNSNDALPDCMIGIAYPKDTISNITLALNDYIKHHSLGLIISFAGSIKTNFDGKSVFSYHVQSSIDGFLETLFVTIGVKRGFLEKKSLHLQKMRTRWIILKKCYLYSYEKNAQKTKLTEKIDLRDFYFVKKSNNNMTGRFELVSKNCKRIFIAKSQQDMESWINHIEAELMHHCDSLSNNAKYNKDDTKFKLDVEISAKHWTLDDILINRCTIGLAHSEFDTVKAIGNTVVNFLNSKYCIKFKVVCINGIGKKELSKLSHVIKKKVSVEVFGQFQHNIISKSIDCPYMSKSTTNNNPINCPIYKAMKEKYQLTQVNLNHLTQFTHLLDEYGQKPSCKYTIDCNAYKRLENGGNRIDDRCHVKLFRHPPRTRRIKLQENIHSLIINTNWYENVKLHDPILEEYDVYNWNKLDGFLTALINEVIKNGFLYDLCVECGQNDECKHDEYSLLNIADDKINHHRHKLVQSPLNRSEMLSLILYTGCDCNYDLCASQRNGNFGKWKWFDYCLY
eukprot:483583_1